MSDVRRAAELEAIRRKLIPLTAYRQLLNGPEHVSGWLAVDQSMIDTFADATNDHQFIHTDRQRAESETPFGGTIAHGFLTLSLLSALLSMRCRASRGREWVSTTGSSGFVSSAR